MPSNALRREVLVEVRSPSEILATLDVRGMLGELPFMPEMAAYCGRRFSVSCRAEKFCDTIHWSGSRRMRDAVMLEDLRCDGAAHGGCQAECRFFWKEAWLRPVDASAPSAPAAPAADVNALVERASLALRWTADVEGKKEERWRCQATQLHQASERLIVWDPRPYVREYTSGNVDLPKFLRVTARAAIQEPMRKLGLIPEVHLPGSLEKPLQLPPLDLQPGELVQIKSREEIAETLNAAGRNKGLWFDREMMAHCGGTYRVRQRIHRFIDDRDGRMIELKSDCVTLDGVVCSGDLSLRRWFCPRLIYPYWREAWLRRVGPATGPSPSAPAPGR
jgi:hypothetical protein